MLKNHETYKTEKKTDILLAHLHIIPSHHISKHMEIQMIIPPLGKLSPENFGRTQTPNNFGG